MGKRCDHFERIPRDFYPTPAKAVLPLVPHLRGIRTFAEPCCGDGDLVRHLESHGLRCGYQGDIRDGHDALALDSFGGADAIITNPPFARKVLHRMIEHFAGILPTWLLLESDWASTRQAVPFMPCCSDIVPIGRVKWFADSKHASKDNFGWFRFDARHTAGPVLHPWRGRGQARRTVICQQCGKAYVPQRSSARFCSPACKQMAYRKRLSVTVRVTPAPAASAVNEHSDSSELFRYVLHDDIERLQSEGWELLPALDGTHHAEYSALMRRREG